MRHSLRVLGLVLAIVLPVSSGARAQSSTSTDMVDLVTGNTRFAVQLYDVLRPATGGNFVFSPYSVSQALAMTYAGAGGETAAQMSRVLGFETDQVAAAFAFGALNADLVARGNAVDDPERGEPARALQIANALWGEQTFPFNGGYTALLERAYGAGLRESDFIDAPEAAREEINNWVASQTNDRIQGIVPPGGITPATRMVLANAIYFNGAWAEQFNASNTHDGEFHLADGSIVTVPFMAQQTSVSYGAGDGYQIVELRYAGSRFAFTILMPDTGQFETMEAALAAGGFDAAIDQLSPVSDVDLIMPKFTFDSGASLVPALQSLGITDAFDPGAADFAGMIAGTTPEALWIGDVLHKAFIAVDENGTEAAAATVEIMVGSAAPGTEPIEVRIDRPFVFAIRDRATGTVLFLGRVMNPAS